jgi:hypothetical protein
MVNFIHLSEEWVDDIVPAEFKVRMREEVSNIVLAS